MHKKYELIVLDRDGVINFDSPNYIKSPAEWIPIPGSLNAIAKLSQAGYKIVVATNQSGIARGYYTMKTLELIHQKMLHEIEKAGGKIEDIFICPHGPQDNCDCRKPKPGLLRKICEQFKVVVSEILVIGDAQRDLTAAKAIGARAILVLTGHSETAKSFTEDELKNITYYANLEEAAEAIINGEI